ncbi:hypothetical protein IJ579_01860 [bacterium]|nr:hypothetical protein [bacterium]
MKIDNSVQLNTPLKYKKTPNFTGAEAVLRFLDTNQAWGANAVDFFCMVLPRTLTDFSRGSDAGWETARRESMGTINDSSVGLYGTAAGLALAMGINKAFALGNNDIKAASIFADAETLDMMGKIWAEKVHSNSANPLREHLIEVLSRYEALSPNTNGQWVKFAQADIEKAVDILEREIRANGNKISKEALNNAKNILLSSNNVENNFRIVAEAGKPLHSSRYTLDSILENTYKLTKTFTKEKVLEAFRNAVDFESNTFLKLMKRMNLQRSLIGVGIATAVGMSTQPINMYLTKRKTGSEGFVGGGEKDKSVKFKFEKFLTSVLFGAGVLATIGHPKNLIKNLQFKGFTPTINQLKFIYGLTIISRFLAARNENELRESTIKDVLGFANWLILGNFVQKLVAQAFDKTLIKRDGEGMLKWIQNSVLKTRDEVLHAHLGEKAFKDGKALSFNEMMRAVKHNKAAKKQLGILTLAQVAGYVYSGLVLGRGIPKLNIYMTKKRLAKEEEAKKAAAKVKNQVDSNMLTPQNREFLAQKSFTSNTLTSMVR